MVAVSEGGGGGGRETDTLWICGLGSDCPQETGEVSRILVEVAA